MEKLKNLEDVMAADERMQHLVVFDDTSGEFRPIALRDLHSVADATALHDGVPEDIQSHFETARNLFVYSWFFYPFNVAAQLQAFSSAEFALKTKAAASKGSVGSERKGGNRRKKRVGFKELLKNCAEVRMDMLVYSDSV